MNIKEVYNDLIKKELTLDDFGTIVDLKNQCMIEMNQEYYYLCDSLIVDIYINEKLYDDALNICIKHINNIDSIVFKKIYLSFLERAIYILIQKKNYKSAYRYAYMKSKVIDLDNIDEVNRWYLEMAYIYAALNQKDKALMNLKAILNNYPSDSLKSYALSNITKLYIDQKMVAEAKNTLNECITLVYKLNDEEGITYCEYLNAKLYVLENNYRLAKQSFQDIFKNLNQLSDDYLSIANEYISLLIEMALYDEAYRFSIKYIKSVEKSKDLYIKKDFYKNYLKIYILKNKNLREEVKDLLSAIELLEQEIERNDQNLFNETSEDDKFLEVQSRLRDLIAKLEKTINLTNLALKNDSERECLLEFSKSLEGEIGFDEALYVFLGKDDFEVHPQFFENFNMVKSYNYKKNRLYEREFPFNNLSGTVVEMLISAGHEVALDFNETPIPVKNLLSGKSYTEEGIKALLALPLNMEKEMFGCVVFLADESTLIDQEKILNLKIAVKSLENRLISLYYQENVRSLKTIMQTLVKELKEGIYYMEPESRKIILSEELASFLQADTNLSKEDFESRINEDDSNIYANIDKYIENGEAYHLEYRIRIGEKEVLIADKARPYITKDGIIKFYIGTISKLDNEVYLTGEDTGIILNEEEYLKFFEDLSSKTRDLEFKCTFGKFVLDEKDLKGPNYERIREYVYGLIRDNFSDKTFLLNDGSFISVIEINDQRVIDKKVKTILGIADQGIIYDNNAVHFDLKAAVVRFPRDTYNLQEINEFLDIALDAKNRYQIFNDDIHKRFLKKKAVASCVKEQIKNNTLELLFLKLKTWDNFPAFEVGFNIPGLNPKEEIYPYLDLKIRVPLEKLALRSLLKTVGSKARYYFHISCATLDLLLKDEYFNIRDLEKYRNIVLCLDDCSPYYERILAGLAPYEFKININYEALEKINFGALLKYKLNGVYVSKGLEERSKALALLSALNYEVLANFTYPDYDKAVSKTDELVDADNLGQNR